MTTTQAIQTRYGGCHFRSRLEARWAVFFDHLEVPWDYEPEGYRLPSGWYLPDFWLPQQDAWFEIKGARPTDLEQQLGGELREATGKVVYIAWGSMPRDPDFTGKDATSDLGGVGSRDIDLANSDMDYAWCICTSCGKPGVEYEARSERICGGRGHKERNGDHPRIAAAYIAARSARFEHGQKGPA